jgi:hypothetical protein
MVTITAKEIPSISKEIEYVVKGSPPSEKVFGVNLQGIASIQIGKNNVFKNA